MITSPTFCFGGGLSFAVAKVVFACTPYFVASNTLAKKSFIKLRFCL